MVAMDQKISCGSIAMDKGHLYGPLLMQAGCSENQTGRTCTRRVLPVVAVVLGSLSLALTSCGSSSASGGSSNGSGVGSTSTTSTTVSSTDAGIISAWLAAQEAFHQAALTSDPNEPELAVTMIDPQLSGVQSAMARLRAAGEVGRGPTFYGSPRVTSRDSANSTVVSCVHGEEIEVVAATGSPVPGVLGEIEFELVTSTMQLTGSGWKLKSQTVGVEACGA